MPAVIARRLILAAVLALALVLAAVAAARGLPWHIAAMHYHARQVADALMHYHG
jgi:hypothetical protein